MWGEHATGMFFSSNNCIPETCLSQTSQHFNTKFAATEKKHPLGFKKVFLDKHVFHQDDQLRQAFAICIPELANVLVLSSILSWDFSFFVMETAAS